MRVAIYIDEKYFYYSWRDDTGRRDRDFFKLAKWIVGAVGVAGQASSPLAELVGGATVALPRFVFSNDPAVHEAALLGEIHKAQMSTSNGFVATHFFVTRWKSERLPEMPDFRQRTLNRVVAAGNAVIYMTEDRVQAVRLRNGPSQA